LRKIDIYFIVSIVGNKVNGEYTPTGYSGLSGRRITPPRREKGRKTGQIRSVPWPYPSLNDSKDRNEIS
jgi:hypothetical protein